MIPFTRRTLFAALGATLLAACSQADGQNPPAAASGPALTDIILGDPDAPITVTEYASWTCPACLQFHEDVMPMLKSEYIETGQVKLVFREFPTPPVSLAVAGFSIARCTGASSYHIVLDDLFDNQTRILNLARNGGDVEKALRDVAANHGQGGDAFDACLADEDIRAAIVDAVSRGDSEGVTSTPTVFINGEKLTGYDWRNADGMRAVLDAAGASPASE